MPPMQLSGRSIEATTTSLFLASINYHCRTRPITMTPANITNEASLAVFKGAKWEHTLTFIDNETGDPLDLTGLGPFVIAFKDERTKALKFYGSAAVDNDPTTGVVVVSATAEQTNTLTLGKVRCGLRDAQNNPYMEGVIPVEFFTPDID